MGGDNFKSPEETMKRNKNFGAESAKERSVAAEVRLRYDCILEAKERLQKLNEKWGGGEEWYYFLTFLRAIFRKEVNNPIAQALLAIIQAGAFYDTGRSGFHTPLTRECFSDSLWQNAREYMTTDKGIPICCCNIFGSKRVIWLGSTVPIWDWEKEFVEETRQILFH